MKNYFQFLRLFYCDPCAIYVHASWGFKYIKAKWLLFIIHLFIILKSIQLFSFHTSSLFIFKVQDMYLNYVLGVCYLYSDITH
jgi:hypothetical protein